MHSDPSNHVALTPADVVTVVGLLNDVQLTYVGISPAMAVVCAYAGDRRDFNTLEYERRYLSQVQFGKHSVSLGDWAARA